MKGWVDIEQPGPMLSQERLKVGQIISIRMNIYGNQAGSAPLKDGDSRMIGRSLYENNIASLYESPCC
ncbi:hypothetical protein D3C85_1473870 [compost metagenome]